MRLLLIGLFILLTISCKNGIQNKPSDILDKNKMVAIIVDLRISEAGNTLIPSSPPLDTIKRNKIKAMLEVKIPDNYQNVFSDNYTFILKKHNTTAKQFKKSHNYYVYFPNDLEEIYEKVIEELSKIEAMLTVKK